MTSLHSCDFQKPQCSLKTLCHYHVRHKLKAFCSFFSFFSPLPLVCAFPRGLLWSSSNLGLVLSGTAQFKSFELLIQSQYLNTEQLYWAGRWVLHCINLFILIWQRFQLWLSSSTESENLRTGCLPNSRVIQLWVIRVQQSNDAAKPQKNLTTLKDCGLKMQLHSLFYNTLACTAYNGSDVSRQSGDLYNGARNAKYRSLLLYPVHN